MSIPIPPFDANPSSAAVVWRKCPAPGVAGPVAAKAPRRCVRPSAPLKFGRTGTPPCRRALPDTGGAGSGGGLAAEADGRRDAVGCKVRTSFVGPPAPPCCALARSRPVPNGLPSARTRAGAPSPASRTRASAACLPAAAATWRLRHVLPAPAKPIPLQGARPPSTVWSSSHRGRLTSAPVWRRYASAGAAPIRPRDRPQAPGLKRGRAPTGGSAPTRILRQSATDPRRALPGPSPAATQSPAWP